MQEANYRIRIHLAFAIVTVEVKSQDRSTTICSNSIFKLDKKGSTTPYSARTTSFLLNHRNSEVPKNGLFATVA